MLRSDKRHRLVPASFRPLLDRGVGRGRCDPARGVRRPNRRAVGARRDRGRRVRLRGPRGRRGGRGRDGKDRSPAGPGSL